MSGHTPRSDIDQISDECRLSARWLPTRCESAGRLLPSTSSISPRLPLLGPFYGAIAVPSVTLLWTSILHCHSPSVATVASRLRYSYSWLRLILVVVSTVATPGEWQCKIRTGSMRRLAVANRPNIFQMLLVS